MAPVRAVRLLIGAGLSVIAALTAAIMSIPLWMKPLIVRQASGALGHPVTIGHLGLHFGGPVTVVMDDVVVDNPVGFAHDEDPLLRIPRLTVRVDPAASVARHRLVIASAEIERPAVRAIATDDGRENYRVPAASHVSIDALRILDGHAHVTLAKLGADLAVSFATQGADATRVVAEARGVYAGDPAVARFVGGVPSDVHDPAQDWPVELTVQNGPTAVYAKGTLQDPLDPRAVVVEVRTSGPDLARLRPLTGVPLAATPPYDLQGKIQFADGVYRLTDVKGRVGRSDLEGAMTITTRPGQRPEIATEMFSRSVDLDDIVSLLSGRPGTPGTPGQTPQQQGQAAVIQKQAVASTKVFPHDPLPVRKFDLVDSHLAFRAQRIQGASMPFDNLVLGMDVVDGVVAVHQLSFGIGRGRLSVGLRLTPRADEALKANADIRFEGVDVARLLSAGGGYKGNGALNGTIQADGTGRSIAEILAGADGAVSLWMMGGDLSSLLADLAGLRLGSALLDSLGGSPTTPVDCFIADLGLRRGILSTRTLLLETEDAVTEGAGSVDLGRERVEMRLRTQSRHLTVGVLPAPLLISGTLKDPSKAPEPATPAGQGGLAGVLASFPSVQLGADDAPRCSGLLRQVRKD